MVTCPRCSQPVDETTRTTCPLCFTPLPTQDAAAQPAPPMPTAPPQNYAPQSGGVMPLAPPDAPPAVAPLNVGQNPMPAVRPMPTSAPMSVPTAAPRMEANQRMTLSGEIIEAPQPMSNAPAAGNSQYQARPSAGAPRVEAKPERSGPNIGIIALVLVLLGGGGGGWYYWMHRTNPKDQAQMFLDSVKTMNPKGMYETMEVDPEKYKNEDDYIKQTTDTQNKVPGMKDMLTGLFANMQFKAGDAKINGNEATVPVTISGSFAMPLSQQPKDMTQTVELPMKNFNGVWKVPKSSSLTNGAAGLMSKMGGQLGGK